MLGAAVSISAARQQEVAAQAAEAVDTKAERAVLQLKAHTDTQLAQIRGDVARLEARMVGQFKLLYWMLGFLIAGVVAIALKIFMG